jgi:PAS domain S-box-containing protein
VQLGEGMIKLLPQVIEAVGQAVIATNLAGEVFAWNRSAERLYGWSLAEALGRNILTLTPTRKSEAQARAIFARLKEGETWSGEFEVQRRDGSSFTAWVVDAPIVDARGALAGVVGISVDAAEERAAPESLPRQIEALATRLAEVAASRGDSSPVPHAAPGSRGRVLLIDDEAPLLRVGTRTLERLGYEVSAYVLPEEALAAVRADPGRFDVVLTDHNMPKLTGVEVARALAEIRPDLPVVLLSGSHTLEDDELAAANIRCRIDKPYSRAALDQVIALLLERG